MGFEDSMIEEGFHDEGEYLEHLIGKAEDNWITEYNQRNDFNEYPGSEDDGYEDEECLEEDRKKYIQWARKNPLEKELFVAWANVYWKFTLSTPVQYFQLYIEYWIGNEEYRLYQLESLYGPDFQNVYNYLKWRIENPIENSILLEEFEKNDMEFGFDYSNCPPDPPIELPECEILLKRVEFYEDWMKSKREYDNWKSNTIGEEKELFFKQIKDVIFNGDISAAHIRRCIEKEDIYDSIKENILRLFDIAPDKNRDLIYEMECIRFYSFEYIKTGWAENIKNQIYIKSLRNSVITPPDDLL